MAITLNGVSHSCKSVVLIPENVFDTTQECLSLAQEYALSKQGVSARLLWAEIETLIDRKYDGSPLVLIKPKKEKLLMLFCV